MEISFENSNEYIRMVNYNEKNTHGNWLYANCNIDKVNIEKTIQNIRNKFIYLLTK